MKLSFETRRGINLVILIQTLCSLLNFFMAAYGLDVDIYCLKSIKDSLQDPNNYLSSSWKFINKTEGFICRFNGVECWHPDENRVLNLKLSNMGLKGQFPRGIRNCTSLTGLDLSGNDLSGSIPSDISEFLHFATTVDLSHNNFSGQIPASLANFTYLNSLNLDNNRFSGQIPPELGRLARLRSASFANNELSGEVPAFDYDAVAVSYANNMGLCGGPLAPCSSTIGPFRESFKDGLLVGFAFSFVSVIVAYVSCCGRAPWTQLKWTRTNNIATKLGKYICYIMRRWKTRFVAAHLMHELLPLRLQDKGTSKTIALLMEGLSSTMTLDELNDATESFSIDNAIGVGKMGIMYKGMLPNSGSDIAVKRLFGSQMYGIQVLLEIRILGKLRHRNVVPLLGFSLERNERILVYQYMSNGRLSKWLHPLESEVVRLAWPERTKIALGVARALSWLHHNCNLHIVHLDISSECILLDEDFEPKVSNFGEAKFMNPNSYDDLGMAFYVKDGKKDVYDFGSVLFELLTGKTFKELSSLSTTTNLSGDPSNFYDAIDKSLFGKGFENEVFTLIKIACECVQPLPDQRPTMLQVYNNMRDTWEGQHELGDDSDTPMHSEIVSDSGGDEIVEL